VHHAGAIQEWQHCDCSCCQYCEHLDAAASSAAASQTMSRLTADSRTSRLLLLECNTMTDMDQHCVLVSDEVIHGMQARLKKLQAQVLGLTARLHQVRRLRPCFAKSKFCCCT
jgi:hypothetical protein